MGTDIFYKKIMMALLFIVVGHLAFGQETVSKKIEKSYGLTNSGELHLNNKYGDVIINGWERSSVKLSIAIEVSHRKKENAEDILDRIDVSTKVTKDFVNLATEINENSTGFFAKYFSKVNPFDLDKSNIKINYTIYLPNNAEMDITNKFGDVIITDWQGKLKANVEHGNVWVNDDLTNANISVKFGELHSKSITYANLTIRNGELDLDGAKQLRLNSSGTTMELGTISRLEVSSSKDEINIDEVGSIHGNLDFTKVHINTLGEEVDIKTKVADFWISEIRKPDSKIFIDQESSEFNINITGQSLIFNATLEQGLLRIPKSFTDIHTDVISKAKKVRKINATYGNGPYGEFVLTGLKGIILLKEN